MNRLLAALAALVIATSCGGSPAKETRAAAATTDEPTTPTAAVAEQPPSMPRRARSNSAAGAQAFARHYLDVRNYALRTGRTAELRAITAPECIVCFEVLNLVEATYRTRGSIRGGLWQPVSPMTNVPCSECGGWNGNAFLQGSIHLEPATILGTDGQPISEAAGSNHDRGITMMASWRDGRWYVENLSAVGGQQP